MLTIEQCRKIQPELRDLTDEEVLEVINDMYGIGELAFEKWQQDRVPKISNGILQKNM